MTVRVEARTISLVAIIHPSPHWRSFPWLYNWRHLFGGGRGIPCPCSTSPCFTFTVRRSSNSTHSNNAGQIDLVLGPSQLYLVHPSLSIPRFHHLSGRCGSSGSQLVDPSIHLSIGRSVGPRSEKRTKHAEPIRAGRRYARATR